MSTACVELPIAKKKKFTTRVLDTDDHAAILDCQRLRHDFYADYKGWVRPERSGQETDHYDSACHHLAVFEDGAVVAYLRALSWTTNLGFMLEHDFRQVVPEAALVRLIRNNSFEISRLVVAPGLQPHEVLQVTEVLFKSLYLFCKAQNIDHLYAVLEAGWLRRFRHCFHLPFQALGPPHRFPDGTKTVAAYATLTELEESLAVMAPAKLSWYRSE